MTFSSGEGAATAGRPPPAGMSPESDDVVPEKRLKFWVQLLTWGGSEKWVENYGVRSITPGKICGIKDARG